MYTLESLQQKNLKELKEIGWELNVFPEGDRRCRQNWIEAIADATLPLLQLLEVSPVEEVEAVEEAIEVQAQEPIETSPFLVRNDRVRINSGLFSGMTGRVMRGGTRCTVRVEFDRRYEPSGVYHAFVERACLSSIEPAVESVTEKLAASPIETPPGVESKFGRIVYPKPTVKPIAPTNTFHDEQPPNRGDGKGRVEIDPKLSQSAIALAAKNSPGVSRKTSTAHQLLELFKSSAHIIPDSPAGETEGEVLESAIGLAGENHLRSESDQNPILTGIPLSDRFLAHYSPPQSENIHYQADTDGQLSLLDFEVETGNEPPDPDDFESLDAFNEAMTRWDTENAEALAVSMDSMCEWAPCPAQWYEPEPENLPLKASSMRELSPAAESSSTFSIPTFDAWCDRANPQTDSDEPPDTGNYAKLPGPKPPKFPPMAIGQSQHDRHISSSHRYCIIPIS